MGRPYRRCGGSSHHSEVGAYRDAPEMEIALLGTLALRVGGKAVDGLPEGFSDCWCSWRFMMALSIGWR